MKKNVLIGLMLMAVMTVAAQTQIEIVVHRGTNALAPENTWPSAEAALQYGAKWIEVDVRKSKDGVLFNLHDETLDRTTNGKGKLADMMAKEVSQLDAGSWFGDETMLREFIALAPEMKIKVNAGDIDRLKYW